MKRLLVWSLPLVVVAVAGCAGGNSTPMWGWQGTVGQQRSAAHKFDPYPSNTGGPPLPEVRPREYDAPPAEPYQGRWNVPGDRWYDRGGF